MIYVLLNPETFEPFYVGKSKELVHRLRTHKHDGIPVVVDHTEKRTEREWHDLLVSEGFKLQQTRSKTCLITRDLEYDKRTWGKRVNDRQEEMRARWSKPRRGRPSKLRIS